MDESSYLENETPLVQAKHFTMVLEGSSSELPHSVERPCPSGQVPHVIHSCEPSSFSTQYSVGLQGFVWLGVG